MFNLLSLLLDSLDVVVRFVEVVASDADKFQLRKAHNILPCNLPFEQSLKGVKCRIHSRVSLLGRLALFEYLIDFILNENPFERSHMPLLGKLVEPYLQLLTQQVASVLGIVAKDILHTEEAGFAIANDARVGRNGHLAIRESVECIDGLIDTLARCNMYQQLHGRSGIIINAPDFNFTSLRSLHNRLLDALRSGRIGNLGNGDGALIDLIDAGTNLHCTAPQTIVVAAYVHQATRGKVGEEFEILAPEVSHTAVQEFVEVVGQNLRCQAHSNTLNTLRQQQRELHGQRYGLFVPTVIREHPLGNLGAEHHLQSKLREPCLNITRSRCTVTRENVTPVTLGINQEVFLSELHQRIANRSVTVGVELHSVSHNVSNLDAATIVHSAHRVQNAPLNGFQTIVDVGHRTLQNNIRSVVQEPIAIESCEFRASLTALAHKFHILVREFARINLLSSNSLLLGCNHLRSLRINNLTCYIFIFFHSLLSTVDRQPSTDLRLIIILEYLGYLESLNYNQLCE